MLDTHRAGPGLQKREWNRVSEYEVGRPRLRARKNPIPADSGSGAVFPFPNTPYQNATLQLLAWNLRDTDVVLANKTFNTIRQLFTTGQNGSFTPFGGTTAYNKPSLLANIQSNNGLLPSPQSFLVSHLRQIVRADICIADIMKLCYSTYYSFVAGDQNWVYFEGPGAVLPTAGTGPVSSYTGSNQGNVNATSTIGWPVTHNVASLRSGLIDPTIGAEDQGYNIAQNKQFRFNIDPTQWDFTSGSITIGGYTVANTGGNGMQISIELCGVLARGMNG
jgi:hypothetical protein